MHLSPLITSPHYLSFVLKIFHRGAVWVAACLLMTGCIGSSGSGSDSSDSSHSDDEEQSFNISVDSAEHGDLSPMSLSVSDGETGTIAAQPDDGFELESVSGCSGSITNGEISVGPISEDCTLTATFAPTGTVSGTISVPQYEYFDTTVNDPDVGGGTNNSFENPQQIGNPAIVGGFLTRPGTGEFGDRYEDTPDGWDFFKVEMEAGQRVLLEQESIAGEDPQTTLSLIDEDESLRDQAEGDGTLQVTAPLDGVYRVYVLAEDPSTVRYRLHVGVMDTLSAMGLPRPHRPHVERITGEYLVRMESPDTEPSLLQAQSEFNAYSAASALGMQVEPLDGEGKRFLFRNKGEQTLQAQSLDDRSTLRELAALPGVASVAPNYLHKPQSEAPDDELYSIQWHYPMINLPQAWALEKGSNDIVVAVVDFGVDLDHPDLANKLTSDGWDFLEDEPLSASNAGEHGTHVAGTIGAETNNEIGVAGVGWNVSVMPLRACSDDLGGCSSNAVIDAVRYAAGLHESLEPDRPADVINLSLGSPGSDDVAAEIYDDVCDEGILIVAAAGNEGSATPSYPASYPCVFSVAAVDHEGAQTNYSNYNPQVDISAPGGGGDESNPLDFIWSTVPTGGDDDYDARVGTSMASPHVAGVWGLLKSVDDRFDATQVRSWLQDQRLTQVTAGMGSATRTDEYGYGLLDAEKAVMTAIAEEGPALVASTMTLRFDPLTDTRQLIIDSLDENLALNGVTASDSWLSVTQTDGDDAWPKSFEVNVDPDELSAGTHRGELVAEAENGDSIIVSVELTVPAFDPDESNRIVPGVVLLMDEAGEEIVMESDVVDLGNGEFEYEFSAIPPGKYKIRAGTDIAYSGDFCALGDACGAFPDLEEEQLIEVDGKALEGKDFTVEVVEGAP